MSSKLSSSKRSLCCRFVRHNTVSISLFPHACHMPRPSLPPFYHSNNIGRKVRIQKLHNLSRSPGSCYCLLLRTKYLEHLRRVKVSNTPRRKPDVLQFTSGIEMCVFVCCSGNCKGLNGKWIIAIDKIINRDHDLFSGHILTFCRTTWRKQRKAYSWLVNHLIEFPAVDLSNSKQLSQLHSKATVFITRYCASRVNMFPVLQSSRNDIQKKFITTTLQRVNLLRG